MRHNACQATFFQSDNAKCDRPRIAVQPAICTRTEMVAMARPGLDRNLVLVAGWNTEES